MALTKPILYSQSAFDATQAHAFTFNVVGGDQVVANKLVITNQSTSQIVYQQKQTTYRFENTVPANTLINGVYYSAYVITYNSLNQESTQSASIQFYCYSTPSWTFNNIPSSGTINNSSYNFSVTYNQSQGERLSSYSIILYDDERTQISTSGVKYLSPSAPPTIVEYQFDGFDNQSVYYIRAIGTTVDGMLIDTDYVRLFIDYTVPEIFSAIGLINNCDGGYITVKSNLIGIDGKSQPSPPIYGPDGSTVDATASGSYVKWDEGFVVDGDFTASLWGTLFNTGAEIIHMNDASGDNYLSVIYKQSSSDLFYLDMTVVQDGETYNVQSETESIWAPFANQQIWIRKVGSTYTIELHNLQPTPPSRSAVLGQCLLGWMLLGEN